MDLQSLLLIGGGALGFVAAIFTGWCAWLTKQAQILTSRMDDRIEERRRAIAALAKELAELKLYVAENYASVAHLQDVERRLSEALDKINDKLDRLIGERLRPGYLPPGAE